MKCLSFNQVQGPDWENIAQALSGTDRAKQVMYKKDHG